MATKPKPKVGWGELNIALNALVKEGVILSYSAAVGTSAGVSVEVATANGADQAEVVRRVRESLPSAFSEAQVRTRTA
jgi:hypothetical protein